MVSVRKEYLLEEGLAGNKSNGYHPGRTHGNGRILIFRIPRDRYGNFHLHILAMPTRNRSSCLWEREQRVRNLTSLRSPESIRDRNPGRIKTSHRQVSLPMN